MLTSIEFSEHALYACNEKFISGSPPVEANDNWTASATILGLGGWGSFRFLFVDNCGIMYGVKEGKLNTASTPKKEMTIG